MENLWFIPWLTTFLSIAVCFSDAIRKTPFLTYISGLLRVVTKYTTKNTNRPQGRKLPPEE
jgi:hypothetical protein